MITRQHDAIGASQFAIGREKPSIAQIREMARIIIPERHAIAGHVRNQSSKPGDEIAVVELAKHHLWAQPSECSGEVHQVARRGNDIEPEQIKAPRWRPKLQLFSEGKGIRVY